MKKLLSLIALLCLFSAVNARVCAFSNIDTADLKLTSCEFEKDAIAEVLFDRDGVYFSMAGFLAHERYHRTRIFNENGKEFGAEMPDEQIAPKRVNS